MAVFFWITIWQFASMYLGQEILLASPVSVVRKLFELSFTGNFWQSVGFSFVRIVTGFLLAMFLGIFLAVLAYWSKTVEILIAPVIAVVKSTPVASFIILCLICLLRFTRNTFAISSIFLSVCRIPSRIFVYITGRTIRKEIKTDRFFEGIHIRHKIIKDATGVDFVNSDTEAAAQIIGDHDIIAKEVAQKAIPDCSIVFIEGDEMKTMLSGYLATLDDQNPEIIGGQLPDDAFYYKR